MNKKTEPSVPDKTLETLARNFCREAKGYGFSQVDYLRYVNHLLEHSSDGDGQEEMGSPAYLQAPLEAAELPVRGERVTLRAYDREKDLERFREWLSDAYGRYFLLSRTSGRRKDMEAMLENPKNVFGVVELNNGLAIGSVAYLGHDPKRSKAELRKIIGDTDYRGTGLAKEATELWIRYGLGTLKLKKIFVNTLHTNLRNIKLNESLGFKVEGLLRKEALIDGEHRDVLRMGLWHDR